jgi:hypothetical protein
MTPVLILLIVQGLMGTLDNLVHHELEAKLPSSPWAREELTLHALREAIYAVVFLSLGWLRWQGALAGLIALLLAVEVVITLRDFLVEDRSRRLPPAERVLHTLLAVCYGAFLAALAPVLWAWGQLPTAFAFEAHGWLSWITTAMGIGVLLWSIRNTIAVLRPAGDAPDFVCPPSGRTVLVGGATGFIGSALVRHLLARGDRVMALARDDMAARLRWPRGVMVLRSLDDLPAETRIDAVVNLAGAPVIAGRWSGARRWALLKSRLEPTGEMLRLMGRLETPPAVLVSASAVGFYGDRGQEALPETAPAGRGFMADLCRLWEDEAVKAEGLGVRVCRLRFGLVFDPSGGPLPMLTLPARLGLGAVLGGGRQWAPWIALDDAVRLIDQALEDGRYSGAINAVAPDLVTQGEMTRAFAWLLGRPQWLAIPAWPLRLALGEMADLFLAGQRVRPARLEALGFAWARPTLADVVGDRQERRAGGKAQRRLAGALAGSVRPFP